MVATSVAGVNGGKKSKVKWRENLAHLAIHESVRWQARETSGQCLVTITRSSSGKLMQPMVDKHLPCVKKAI